MQIMPATWEILRRRYRLKNAPYDPRQNIMAGTAYLREMYDKFGYPGCLAAYNAGPGRYASWVSGKRKLPRETSNYVNLTTSRIGRRSSFIATIPSSLAKPNAVPPAQSALFISSAAAKREQQDSQTLAPQDAKAGWRKAFGARPIRSSIRQQKAGMMANFINKTLAKKSVGFSVCRIRNFGGQDKRSAVGCSVWLGFLRFIERRFLEAAALPANYSMISMFRAPSPISAILRKSYD